MTEVSADEVTDLIVGGTSASPEAVNFWIEWADGVLDKAEALPGASGYGAADRKKLQRLIAAHALEREEVRVRAGDVQIEYSDEQVGPGLRETSYGRKAIAFDPQGVLENVGLKQPSIESIGTTYDASGPED